MKRILVGLDGSPRAPGVLSAATLVARANGGKLVLLRSVGLPPDIPQDFWKTTDESLLDLLQHQARSYLDEQASRVPKELFERTEVIVGVPWQTICDAARRDNADLIVVGSHGYSGLDHIIGTTAAKVVNHAGCSVLVVRDPARLQGTPRA
ncbi:MAG TPA: universal stress protein [Polyangiaceae bacterium]|nr:universal stress protein [Polyangiaceae bacterium]